MYFRKCQNFWFRIKALGMCLKIKSETVIDVKSSECKFLNNFLIANLHVLQIITKKKTMQSRNLPSSLID